MDFDLFFVSDILSDWILLCGFFLLIFIFIFIFDYDVFWFLDNLSVSSFAQILSLFLHL